jgi:hypothetical protein
MGDVGSKPIYRLCYKRPSGPPSVALTRPYPMASARRGKQRNHALAFAFESSFQTNGVIPWRRYSARTVLAARWKARSARRTKVGVFGPDFFAVVLMG